MDPLQPWHWQSHPLENRSGSSIFAALFRHQAIATLLESPMLSSSDPEAGDPILPHHRYSICAGGPRIIAGHAQLWTPSLGQVLPCLQRLWQRQSHLVQPDNVPESLPFLGGWLGWLGYDLAWEIEHLPWLRSDPLPFPVAYWYEPEAFAVLDHAQQQLWLAASRLEQLNTMKRQLQRMSESNVQPGSVLVDPQLRFLTCQADYEAMVCQAQQHIDAGDLFQANLSLRFAAQGNVDPWSLYQGLQQINPSPFASYWQTPWGAVVSCSPERLVQLRGQEIQTRPIAGTRSRGETAAADHAHVHDLLTNTKEKAEHTMLVDLERNDLGRVCQWGSVHVDEFFTIESYSHVMHLVSNIVGTLRPTCTPIDLIRAVFPGGTITGCPKVRCMEIIETLEPVRRSLFYGSCGYLDVRGNLDLNILIRTLLVIPDAVSSPRLDPAGVKRSVVWGQVGAGIVADSHPTQEWLESLQKAQAQLIALQHMMDSMAC